MRKLTKYTEEEIKKAVENSKSIADVCRKLNIGTRGSNFKTVKRYINYYNISISHFQPKSEQLKELHFKKRIPTIEILVVNSTWTSSFDLKNRLLKEGFKENKCEICNLQGVWNNKPINMQLDHINGINNDNRLENLRMVCPNCHSQTDTFCGKNKGNKFRKDKERSENNGRTLSEINSSIKNRKVIRPEKDLLIELIREKGFTGVGRDYNVNGNSVKKWCEMYKISKYIKDYK